MRLGLRQRVALWCAALVVLSGVAVVLLVVVLSGRFLRQENMPSRLGAVPGATADGTLGAPPPGSSGAAGAAPDAGVVPQGPTATQTAQRAAADRTFVRVRNLGLVTVLGLMVVSLIVAWLVAGRIVRPVKQVTETARSIGRDRQLDRRIAYDGPPDELHDLADEFDAMLARLESAFDAQRAFVANASHELRTPLAVMRTEVDVALDDPDAPAAELRSALHAVGDVVEHTTGLVTSMLALARAETLIDARPIDLGALAANVLYHEHVRFGDRAYESELQEATVAGDAVLLGQLVGNLVRNAVAYNQVGGLVAVRTSESDGVVRLEVENDGPPVPEQEVASLFSRFVRRSPTTDGHGLGLAICEAIARTHDGTIEARARERGGLLIVVQLPALVRDAGAVRALAAAGPP